ncbi:high affinity methionine permease [Microthyrium microscopicum]|uniref:High affinity methionine permease n=1 Tax=Microthyrium microscopicum TaxID=703497 RepID=A0A6A6UJX4_9PEZI|nr:high affinity methionine permease [Microthyrium microscopicum]
MASYLKKLGISKRSTPRNTGPSSPIYDDATKQARGTEIYESDKQWTSNVEPEADKIVKPGELSFEEDTSGGLGRHLGLFSTTFLIIGRIIGTGIFSTPSSITASVGSVGAALMMWVLGLILSFAGLFVWLEFGTMFPRSGGEKVYLEAVYQRPKLLATVIFSTQAILLGFTASGCIVFASNIIVAADHTSSAWTQRGIAVAVIFWVTAIHTFTPKLGVWIMNALGSIKVIILLFIVITGFVVLGGHVKSVPDPHASFRNGFAGSVHSSGPYATALFKVLNSYSGWSNAAYVLNEVKRPVHTLKIAGPLGLGICGALYILANIAYFSVATPKEISASGITVASFFVKRVFGHTAQRVISAFVALSALGNVMTITFAQSRVNQELAKEGVVPFGRFWASSWPAGSPSAGLLLHLIPSLIVIVAIPAGDAYNFILDVEGYPSTIINVFVVVGLFILRWKAPHIPRPFKVWLPIPFFFLVAQCFLLVDPFIRPPGGKGDTSLPYWLYPIVGIVVLIGGVIYWTLWRVVYPKVGKFSWVERKEALSDGTVIKRFVKDKNI